LIKEKSTKRFKAVCALNSQFRWCLTGTPIQNRIDDLAALLVFLRVSPFDHSFKKLIIEPLKQGKPTCVLKLRLLVKGISLRRTKASIESEINLPPRNDHVEKIEFTQDERSDYEFARQHANTWLRGLSGSANASTEYHSILQAILRLRQICNHGTDLWPPSLRARFQRNRRISQGQVTFFSDTLDECEACGNDIPDDGQGDITPNSCPHILCRVCATGKATKGAKASQKLLNHACPLCFTCDVDPDVPKKTTPKKKAMARLKERPDNWQPSSKVRALIKNLQKDRSSTGACFAKRYVRMFGGPIALH
jgi:SWI/SNF-related matrix-associated actin-dependent regulator of chromatin subfamily A3